MSAMISVIFPAQNQHGMLLLRALKLTPWPILRCQLIVSPTLRSPLALWVFGDASVYTSTWRRIPKVIIRNRSSLTRTLHPAENRGHTRYPVPTSSCGPFCPDSEKHRAPSFRPTELPVVLSRWIAHGTFRPLERKEPGSGPGRTA